jgi:HEAT repeat protein
MVAYDLLLVSLWPLQRFQQTADWRLDLPSLLFGALLGAGLVLLFFRFRPRLQEVRDRSLSRVEKTQAWVRAGTEKRFQAETADYVAHYHLGQSRATLEQIFVPPLLLEPPPFLTPDEDGADSTAALNPNTLEAGALVYLWPELAASLGLPPQPSRQVGELLRNGRRVILSAPPGSGKTTLLAYCAHRCATASAAGPDAFLLPIMPVFVHLAELELATAGADPAAPLAAVLQQRASALTAPGIASLLRQKLSKGWVLLLLDGWDELAPGQDEDASQWLAQLLELYPDTRVIAAAGVTGYARLLSLRFVLSGLAPWRGRQALALGDQWAAAADRPERPRLEWYWEPGEAPLAATLRLWQWLYAGRDKRLGGEQRLFDGTLRLLLPDETETPGLAAATLDLWQRLAYELLVTQQLSLPLAAVQRQIEATIAAYGLEGKASLLRQSLAGCGLFRQWHDRTISFLSPVWRDYLAAAHLDATGDLDCVAEHLHDPHWQEVIRQYVTRTGESTLAAGLLDARSLDPWREAPFQVAAWLPEARPEQEWRRSALIQLGQLIVNPNAPLPLRQRAIAAIARSGDSGVVALLRQLLQRSDVALRQTAAAALGPYDPELSVPVLEQLFADSEPRVRAAAVYSIGWQNSQRGEKPLLTALVSSDEVMSRAAAESLAYHSGEGWEVLQEAATDDMPVVRRAAARGFGLVAEPWAVDWLQKLERDDEWVVQSAATQELERLAAARQDGPWQPVEAGDLVWLIQWAAQRKQAVPAGAAAIPLLCEVLVSAYQPDDRMAAASSLGSVYLPDVMRLEVESALREAAHSDENAAVRAAAFAALSLLRRATTA